MDLDGLLELSGNALVEGDVETQRLTRVRPERAAIAGESAAAHLGRPLSELVHAIDRDRLAAALARVRAGEPVAALELRHVDRSGSERWARWDIAPVGDGATFRALVRESSDRYRILFDSIADGFAIIEPMYEDGRAVDYRFVEANPAFETNSGMRDVVGRSMRSMVPDIERFWIETYARVAETGESERFESSATALERWFDVYAFRFGPAERRHVAVFFKDITEKKNAELRARFFRELDDTTRGLDEPEAITKAAVELLGRHLRVDRCAYAVVAEDEDTFTILDDYCVGLPSIVGVYRLSDFGAEVLRSHRAGEPYVVGDVDRDPVAGPDLAAYRQTGIRAVISVPLNKGDRFVGGMAVHMRTPRAWKEADVDLLLMVANRCWESIERARVARELAESESNLRALAEAVPTVVWISEPSGAVTYLNARWTELTGVAAEESLDEAWTAAVHPDDRERVLEQWRRACETGDPFEGDVRYRAADGAYRWHLFRGVPQRDREGRIRAWYGASVDITERKEVEDARERMIVAERSARIESERSGRMKDEFLATLSHELRTPLTAVLGWTQLLRRNAANADVPRALEIIERNAKMQHQLIEDLLDVSRIISGKLHLDRAVVDVADAVRAALDSVQPSAQAKGIEIDCRPLPSAPVDGNLGRLQQVVWNLLSNAVKFTPNGGTVRVSLVVEGDRVAEVRVSDSGPGIEPRFLPFVFDRFAQADGSSTRTHGGLGLGLSIVKHLTELHGGNVRVESTPGHGATFVVRLPLAAGRVVGATSKVTSAELRPNTLTGIEVLVVDDSDDSRDLVRQVLERHDARVKVSSSAKEALEVLSSDPPDVLISDIGMPEVDGYELLRRARSSEGLGKHVPAIALTAYASESDRASTAQAGFAAHVTKPVDVNELVGLVAKLSQRAGEQSSRVE